MDSNGRLYALVGDGGDLFTSTNGGATWNMISGSLNYLHGFALIGTTLYANTWGEVYVSTDNGTNWTQRNVTVGMQFLDVRMSAVTGVNDGLIILGTQGVWISVDAGINWKKIYDKKVYQVEFSSGGDIYLAVPEVGIVKHPVQSVGLSNWDQSKTTVVRAKQFSGEDVAVSIGVNRNNNNKLFIVYQNSAGTGLVYEVSTNGGTNWSVITSATTGVPGNRWFTFAGKFFHITHSVIHEVTDGVTPTFTQKGKVGFSFYQTLAFYYKNFNEIYVGVEGDGIWKSTDNGGTWAAANGTPAVNASGVPISAIMRLPARDIEVMGTRLMIVPHSDSYGYWTSTNEGANWSWISTSFGIKTHWPHKVFERLQDNSIIIPSNSGTQRTTDGLVWTQMSTEDFEDYVTVGATELYGFRGPGTIMKSVNNGQTWTNVTVTGYPTNIGNVQVAAYDGVNFYVAMNRAGQTQYWRINATTLAATQLNVGLNTAQFTTSGMFVFKGKLYIGDYQKIAISNDQGNTYKYLDYQHNYLFPINQGLGGIGISRGGSLVITQDDGITFSSTALPNTDGVIVNLVNYNGAVSFAAGTGGVAALKFTTTSTDTLVYNATRPYIDFGWQKMDGPTDGGRGRRLFKSSTDQLFVDGWTSIHRFNSTTNSWEFLDNAFINNSHGMFHDGTNIYQIRWGDLYKSTNGGNTFSFVSSGQFTDANGNGQGIYKTSTGTIFVLTGNGLYRSTNDGVAFTKVRSGRTYTSIAQAGTNLLTVSTDNTNMFVERSTDGGVTWSSAQTGITFPSVDQEEIIAAEGTNTFVVTTANNIFRSTDGGVTWASIKSNMPETNNWCCSSRVYIAPNGDYYFAAHGYPMRLYVSTDKGASWTRKNTNTSGTKFNDINDIIWVGTRIYAISSYYEGVLFSDNGGATFSTFENNRGFNAFSEFEGGQLNINNGIISIGQGQVISISKDTGANWTNSTFTANKMLKKQNSDGTVDIIAYGSGTPLRSTNNGETWTPVRNEYYWAPFLAYNGSTYIMIGNDGPCCGQKFYSSTDLINWNPITVSGIPSYITGYTSLATLGSRIFVTGQAGPELGFRTEAFIINSGVATRFTEDRNVVQAISRDNKVYLFSQSGYIFESENGTSWTRRAVPSGTTKLIFANNGYLFLSGENGLLWVSRDSGATWQNVSASNIKTRFGDIAIDPATGIAYGTHPSRPLFKSAVIVIPNDKAGPTVSSFIPAHNATNVSATGFELTIIFNESPRKAAGKSVRIYEQGTITPVETILVSNGVVIDNKITFTPTFIPKDLVTYYVAVEDGAFTDFYNNVSLAIGGSSVWSFTMEDASSPTITFTTSNLEKGVAKTFEVTVQDAGGIDINSVKIYYRGIATQNTATLASASLTQSTGGSSINSKFTVTAQESWYDAMGLEFYIEAKDVSGNTSRFPTTANTYLYSYISYPVAQRPKITGLSFGNDATAYRNISVPFSLSDNRIATVFDEFGSANKKSWRMFTYAGDTKWNEFDGGSGLSTLERGKGYWIITKSNVELFIEGAQTPEFNRTKFDEISLNAGWNQIGNPYPVAISWTETIAGKTGIGVLKKYSNGSYTNADVLNPYEGAFVFVTSSAQKLKVRFQGITSGGRSGAGASPDLANETWELPIKVEQGQTSNEFAGIGMNPNADLNLDQFDDLNMPTPEGLPKSELSFTKHGGAMKELAKDVVPTQSEFIWYFNFNTNSNEHATFRWENDLFGNNSKELVLMDEGTQRLIDMRSETSYTFNPTVTRSFRIYFGENLMSKIRPSKILLGHVYPNPASEQVSVPFALSDVSSSYLVRLEAYNIQGTRVGVLYEGELAPGFYQRDWSLQAASLANGVYFIKMSVTGNASRETQIQKIIINR